jgi:lipoyl(octanoyl) transferase
MTHDRLAQIPAWHLYLPGLVSYADCWQWQQQLLRDRKINPALPDVLILVEHPPVYTLGQGADWQFVKFDPAQSPIEIFRVERGGEVTYHAPGQLVAYPILNLKRYQPDLHWYLRQLEAVILDVLANLGLPGERIPGLTGVWIEGRKVAAIGVKASRWITMHGFAINVCMDLAGFSQIVPCGIADKPVGSLAEWIPDLRTQDVSPLIVAAIAKIFQVELQMVSD